MGGGGGRHDFSSCRQGLDVGKLGECLNHCCPVAQQCWLMWQAHACSTWGNVAEERHQGSASCFVLGALWTWEPTKYSGTCSTAPGLHGQSSRIKKDPQNRSCSGAALQMLHMILGCLQRSTERRERDRGSLELEASMLALLQPGILNLLGSNS